MRNRSLGFVLATALVVLIGSSSATFASLPRLALPLVEGYSTVGNVVQVTVANPASVDQVCTVTVTSLSVGVLVTTSVTQSVAGGGSASVSVPASGLPVSVRVSAGFTDGNSPVPW